MQAVRDAAVLLILGVLLISVRITPLQKVDWIPPAQAAEHALDAASEAPNDGPTVFVLEPDGHRCEDRGTRARQRVADRAAADNVDCT